jgi:RNA polymerase sigma-70 factor (ECF subfamily)
MSFQEIANHLDISVNTALGRMRYAIKKMQKLVKENDIFLVN